MVSFEIYPPALEQVRTWLPSPSQITLHGRVFRNEQAGQILREMAAGRFIGEEIAKLDHQRFHHL